MPTPDDLLGTGMPPLQAAVLGNGALAQTAAGADQAGATAIRSHLVTMTATGADGLRLPSNALVGTPYWVWNSSASTGLIYAPVGATMNTTLNGSLSLATHKLAVFIQTSKGNWASILTA